MELYILSTLVSSSEDLEATRRRRDHTHTAVSRMVSILRKIHNVLPSLLLFSPTQSQHFFAELMSHIFSHVVCTSYSPLQKNALHDLPSQVFSYFVFLFCQFVTRTRCQISRVSYSRIFIQHRQFDLFVGFIVPGSSVGVRDTTE